MAELSIRVVGKNFEFGDSIERRLEDKASIDAVEIVGAVDQEVVGLGPLAIDGICLAIAKGLVTMHGGDIGVDSRLGLGSTFWFTVPAYTPGTRETAA